MATIDPTIPSFQPPPGVTPDFTKRPPLLGFTIATCSIFISLMYMFLGIRVYMRKSQKQKWILDDSLAVAAAVSSTVFAALNLRGAGLLSKHSWDLRLVDLSSARAQMTMVGQVLFNGLSRWLGKFCLLVMYYRIFGHIPIVRMQLYITAALTLPIFISIFLQPSLIAPPAGKPWGTVNPQVNMAKIPGLMVGIANLVVDLLIAYIPIPVITKLNLSKNKRNGIIALFATGIIAVVAAISGLYFRVRLYQGFDPMLYGYIGHNCALIESTISVILSSLPSTAKFWRSHIEPTHFIQFLRSRLTSHGETHNTTDSRGELPSFIRKAVPVRRKRNMYSIGTNTSQTRLSESKSGLGLKRSVQGVVRSEAPDEERLMAGDIQRTISVEQSSITYPEMCKLRTEQNLF
ncbi:hypothetical protein BDV95DRAFT_585938 [Massariosphaeria phaeospora]|uniref:Rhodopsin domain-containing protein n=1 Tax=Massariosphaeria phaeospora TaxID=100035 RepID=A0A7C8I0I7_9PLEO|nr:hypothetical protein BDV95DRAFT_585938 [Massariosphaeria phaeospora]